MYIYPWLYPFAGGHNRVVWGGVGWGWWRSLHMNTSLMLRRTGVGWGGSLAFGFYNLFFKKNASCIEKTHLVFILTFFWIMFLLVAWCCRSHPQCSGCCGNLFFFEVGDVTLWYLSHADTCVFFENWNTHMLYCDSGRVVNISADLVFPQFWGEETGGVSGPAYVFILTCVMLSYKQTQVRTKTWLLYSVHALPIHAGTTHTTSNTFFYFALMISDQQLLALTLVIWLRNKVQNH